MKTLAAYSGTRMRALERPLLEAGEGPALMARASHGLFARIRELTDERRYSDPTTPPQVVGLVGKGNNGADTLFALAQAARSGLETTAILTSGMAQFEAFADFERAGGQAFVLSSEPYLAQGLSVEQSLELCLSSDVVIDGILGTGARGGLRGTTALLVRALAESAHRNTGRAFHTIACDIPSGIDADTGEVFEPVLPAEHTVTFAAPKTGLWVDPGASYVGEISVVDIGLNCTSGSAPSVLMRTVEELASVFTPPERADQKYSHGMLELVSGSETYPGAAFLTAGAALATGVGMLNYVGPESVSRALVQTHPEVVLGPARKQPHAVVLGPGLDLQDPEDRARALETLARRQESTVILDAGSVTLFTEVPAHRREQTILTPHSGELAALIRDHSSFEPSAQDVTARPWYWASVARDLTQTTILLKGFVSLIVSTAPVADVQHADTTRLAVAGSGDVLAGIIGAIAAVRSQLGAEVQAAFGALLHSRAGWFASQENVVPISAITLIEGIGPAIYDAATRAAHHKSGH